MVNRAKENIKAKNSNRYYLRGLNFRGSQGGHLWRPSFEYGLRVSREEGKTNKKA